jgi:hypothetical protein
MAKQNFQYATFTVWRDKSFQISRDILQHNKENDMYQPTTEM